MTQFNSTRLDSRRLDSNGAGGFCLNFAKAAKRHSSLRQVQGDDDKGGKQGKGLDCRMRIEGQLRDWSLMHAMAVMKAKTANCVGAEDPTRPQHRLKALRRCRRPGIQQFVMIHGASATAGHRVCRLASSPPSIAFAPVASPCILSSTLTPFYSRPQIRWSVRSSVVALSASMSPFALPWSWLALMLHDLVDLCNSFMRFYSFR